MSLKKDKEEYAKVIQEYQDNEALNQHRNKELSNQEQILA